MNQSHEWQTRHVTDAQRRKAFLEHAREQGFLDGERGGPKPDRYGDDPAARAQYLTGARIGLREKRRAE